MALLEVLYAAVVLTGAAFGAFFFFLLGMVMVWGIIQLYVLIALGSKNRRGTDEDTFFSYFILWLLTLWNALYGLFVALFATLSATASNLLSNLPALLVTFVVVALAIVLKVAGPYMFSGLDSIWNCFMVLVFRDLGLFLLNLFALGWATITPILSLIFRVVSAPLTASAFLLTACTSMSIGNVGLQTGLIFVEFSDATVEYFGVNDPTLPFNFFDTSMQAGEAIFSLADPIFCMCPSAETFTAIPFLAAVDPELHNATDNVFNALFYFPVYRFWLLAATEDTGKPPPLTPFWDHLCQALLNLGQWIDINVVRIAQALADFYNLMTGADIEIEAVEFTEAWGFFFYPVMPISPIIPFVPVGFVDPACAILSFLNITVEVVLNYPQLYQVNYPAYQEYLEFEPTFFFLRKWVDDICLLINGLVSNLGPLGGLRNIIDVVCCVLGGVVKVLLAVIQILVEILIESLYAWLGLQQDWFEALTSQIFSETNPSIGIVNLKAALLETGVCLDELLGIVCVWQRLLAWGEILASDLITFGSIFGLKDPTFIGEFSLCCLQAECRGGCAVNAECDDISFDPFSVSEQTKTCQAGFCVYAADTFLNISDLTLSQEDLDTLCLPQLSLGEEFRECLVTDHGTWVGAGGDDFLYCQYSFTVCPSDCVAIYSKIDVKVSADAFKEIFACITDALLRDNAVPSCGVDSKNFICCLADLIDLAVCLIVELVRLLIQLFLFVLSIDNHNFFVNEPINTKALWNSLQATLAKLIQLILSLINIQGTCGPCGMESINIGGKIGQLVNAILSVVFELGEIVFCLVDELVTAGQVVTVGDIFEKLVQLFAVFIQWIGDVLVATGEFLNCFNFVPGGDEDDCDPINQPGKKGVGLGTLIIDIGRVFQQVAFVMKNEIAELIGCIIQLMVDFVLGIFSGNFDLFFDEIPLFFEKIFVPIWNELGAAIFSLFTDCDSPIGGIILIIENVLNSFIFFIGGVVCNLSCGLSQFGHPVGDFQICFTACRLTYAGVNVITCADAQPLAPTPAPTVHVPLPEATNRMTVTQVIPNFPDAVWTPSIQYNTADGDPGGPVLTVLERTGSDSRIADPAVFTVRNPSASYDIRYDAVPFSAANPAANITLQDFECLDEVTGAIVRDFSDISNQQISINLDDVEANLAVPVNLECVFLWNDNSVALPPPLSLRVNTHFDPPLLVTSSVEVMFNITRYDSDTNFILDTQLISLFGPMDNFTYNFTDTVLVSDLIVSAIVETGTLLLYQNAESSDGTVADSNTVIFQLKFNNVHSYFPDLFPSDPDFYQTEFNYNWAAPAPIFSIELVQSIPDIPAAAAFQVFYAISYQNEGAVQLNTFNLTGKTEQFDISSDVIFPMKDPDVDTVHFKITASPPGGATLANAYCVLINPDQPNVALTIPTVSLVGGTYEMDLDDNTQYQSLQDTVALRCGFVWYPMGYVPLTVPTFAFGLTQSFTPNVTSPGTVSVTYDLTQIYTDNGLVTNSVTQSATLVGPIVVPVMMEFNASLFASDFLFTATAIVAADTVIGSFNLTLPYVLANLGVILDLNGSDFVQDHLRDRISTAPSMRRLIDPFAALADAPLQTEINVFFTDLARKRGDLSALPDLPALPLYPSSAVQLTSRRKRAPDFTHLCPDILFFEYTSEVGSAAAELIYSEADNPGFCQGLYAHYTLNGNVSVVEDLHLQDCYLGLRGTCGWNLLYPNAPIPADTLSNKLTMLDIFGEAVIAVPAYLGYLGYRARASAEMKEYFYSTYLPEQVGPLPPNYEAELDYAQLNMYLEEHLQNFESYLQDEYPQLQHHGLLGLMFGAVDEIRQYLQGTKSISDLLEVHRKRSLLPSDSVRFDLQKQKFSDNLDHLVVKSKLLYRKHGHVIPPFRHWQSVVTKTATMWGAIAADYSRDRLRQSVTDMSQPEATRGAVVMYGLQNFAPKQHAQVSAGLTEVMTLRQAEIEDHSGYRKLKLVFSTLTQGKTQTHPLLGLPRPKMQNLPTVRDVGLERLLNTTPNIVCFDLRVPACCDADTETCKGACTLDSDCAGIFEFDSDFATTFFCDAGFCRYETIDTSNRSCCALNLALNPDPFGVLLQCRQKVDLNSQAFFVDNCLSSDSQCLEFTNNSLCPGLPSGLMCSFRLDQCDEPCVGETQDEICVNCVLLEHIYEIFLDALTITQRYYTDGKYFNSLQRFQESWNGLFPPEAGEMMKKTTYSNHLRKRRRPPSSSKAEFNKLRQKRASVFDWYKGVKKSREHVVETHAAFYQAMTRQVMFPSLPDAPLPDIPSNAFEMAIPEANVSLTWQTLEMMEPILGFFSYEAQSYLEFFTFIPEFFLNTNASDTSSFYYYLELALVCRQEATICCTRGFGLKDVLAGSVFLLTLAIFVAIVFDARLCGCLCPFVTAIIFFLPILAWGWNPVCGLNAIPHCVGDEIVTIWDDLFPESIAWPGCLVTTPGYDPNANRPCGVLLDFEVPLCESVGVSDAVDDLLFALQYTTVKFGIPDPLECYKSASECYDPDSELTQFVRNIPFFGDKLDNFTFQSLDEIPCAYTLCFYWSIIDSILFVIYWILGSILFLPLFTLIWALASLLPALLIGYVGLFYILAKQIEETSTNSLPSTRQN